MCSFLEVLLLVDHMVQGLIIPGVRVLQLEDGQGYADVGMMAANQELAFAGITVLFLITGCAEVEAQHPAIVSSVVAALHKVVQNVPYSKIIIGAPIPKPSASQAQLKQLFNFSKQLQLLTRQDDRLEYTKTGLMFYGPGGVYANLMSQLRLTNQGLARLKTQVVDRLLSTGLVTLSVVGS